MLETGLLGSAAWFLIPYKEAADSSDVSYLVSGILRYESNGKAIKLDLSSEVITVKPEPELELFYFLERYVESDDPFTPAKEPAVPFTLGLLIKNKGYGVANHLKLSSAQPEIVENEKGLLIDFKIENAFINNQEQAKASLNLDFGDVYSFEFKHVLWQLRTSLRGTFSNLNATFTNTNPNGDPKLSLIDKLEYKQLAKLVKVDQPTSLSDSLADFLVYNELTLLPDRVYLSNVNVNFLNVSYIENVTVLQTSSSEIMLKVRANETSSLKSAWFYAGLFIGANLIPSNYKIFKVLRSDGRVLPIENVWTRKFDGTSSVLSIFDHALNVDYDLIYEIQIRDLNFTEPETTADPTFTTTLNHATSSLLTTSTTLSHSTSPVLTTTATLTFTTTLNQVMTSILTRTSTSNAETSLISSTLTNKINTTRPIFDFNSILGPTATLTPTNETFNSQIDSAISLKCAIRCSSTSACSLLTGYANWYVASNGNSTFSKIYSGNLYFNSTTNELYAIVAENIWKAYLNYRVYITFF